MKKILALAVVILISILSLSFFSKKDILGVRNLYYYSPCKLPITYKIGSIDPKFGLSTTEVLNTTTEAAQIWNKALGKNLFIYDPQSLLSINMLYDKRQSLTTQASQLENNLKTNEQSLNTEIANYKKSSLEFKNRMKAFSDSVDYWNTKGGAPKDEYDKLIQEQQSLKNESERLNGIADRLDLSTQEFNAQVGELKHTVGTLNTMLEIKPEEGIYDPNTNRIEVYFNNNRDELIRTLAHELGHSRGLSHDSNPEAIMYPTTTQYLLPVRSELNALTEICRTRPYYEVIWTRFETSMTRIIKAYQNGKITPKTAT